MSETKTSVGKSTIDPPTCSCIVLCDDVLVSQARHKHILHGIVGAIYCPSLPATVGPYMAYVRLSNVYPSAVVTVALQRASDDLIVWELRAEMIKPDDPLVVYTLSARIESFVLETSGRYMIVVKCQGDVLAQVPVMVHGPPAGDEHGDGD